MGGGGSLHGIEGPPQRYVLKFLGILQNERYIHFSHCQTQSKHHSLHQLFIVVASLVEKK